MSSLSLQSKFQLDCINSEHHFHIHVVKRATVILLTHNAFLWCWGDDIAYVQVLRGQFTVQTQEITETPFYWKLISLKQRQGGLGERDRKWYRGRHKRAVNKTEVMVRFCMKSNNVWMFTLMLGILRMKCEGSQGCTQNLFLTSIQTDLNNAVHEN